MEKSVLCFIFEIEFERSEKGADECGSGKFVLNAGDTGEDRQSLKTPYLQHFGC